MSPPRSVLHFTERSVPDGGPAATRLGVFSRARWRKGNVRAADAWVEIPLTSEWTAWARLVLQGGSPVVGEVRVFPREPSRAGAGVWSADVLGFHASAPAGGLTARMLREVKLGEVPRHSLEVLRRLAPAEQAVLRKVYPDLAGRLLASIPPRPRAERRTGRPDRFYAELADEYVKRVARGSRRPVQEIAERRPELTAAKVRDMLHQARVRGLLSPGEQGRRGGYLLQRATALLARPVTPRRNRTRRRGRR